VIELRKRVVGDNTKALKKPQSGSYIPQ